eukprot:s1299_g10.t1
MLGQLHDALRVQPKPWLRGAAFGRVEIHSICSYKPDPTSKTTLESPLPDLSVPNHQAYAQRHGYRYVVHTENALPDREAHYSKMYVVYHRMTGQRAHWAFNANRPEDPPPDWIFFIDCDAFFTDFATSISDLINTYAQGPGPGSDIAHFLVAEDPGGINTGVFLIRNSPWSLRFLERVASSTFTVAWDQSMFFWHMVRGAMEMGLEDFSYPTEVRLVHQAHFNAFVPPASVDWMAHEWQPSNFVRHFAGCPWQEQPCLQMMMETAEMAALPQSQQQEMWQRSSTHGVWSDTANSERIGSCQLSVINLIAHGFASRASAFCSHAAPENCCSVHTSSSIFDFVFPEEEATGAQRGSSHCCRSLGGLSCTWPVVSRLCAHVQGWPVAGAVRSRSQLVRLHGWCKARRMLLLQP